MGKTVFHDTAILVVFWGFIGHKMTNIDPFGLKIGLPIDHDPNDEQNKKQLHMCKVAAKMANIFPKIGQLPLGRKDFNWV